MEKQASLLKIKGDNEDFQKYTNEYTLHKIGKLILLFYKFGIHIKEFLDKFMANYHADH